MASLLIIGFWVVISAYAIHVELPATAVDLPFESQLKLPIKMILPEGWEFFTKNPRDADPVAYRQLRPGVWGLVRPELSGGAEYAFGFNRRPRAMRLEAGLFVVTIPPAWWRPCSASPNSCLSVAPEHRGFRNRVRNPTLCGAVGFIEAPPVPWAWALAGNVTMPSRVVRLWIQC